MIVAFIVAALLAGIDQIIKLIVTANLKSGGEISILNGLVEFFYCENKGMAFGMLENGRLFFIVFTLAIIIALVIYTIKTKPKSKFLLASISLIIGGGLGNLIDRILYGYVIDYIQLSFFSPVCNFADYCITAGTVMLVVYVLFFTSNEEDKKIKAE